MSDTGKSKESNAPGSSNMSDTGKSKESNAPGSSNLKSTTDDVGDSTARNSADLPGEIGRKIFNDPVHGHITLHPLCVKIIDTPEFQRLRFIKQLGGAYLVYPGAAHNRFEHSIGVCHLAGRFLRALKSRLEHDDIDEKDILCVEIAGLCHDLGHGPFSHLFDEIVIPAVREENEEKWKHEDGSVRMFELIYTQLESEFCEAKLDETDKEFIKTLIKVPEDFCNPDFEKKLEEKIKNKQFLYQEMAKKDITKANTKSVEETKKEIEVYTKLQERIKNKQFLYQIVSNKESGVDVDKWDYFARDALMTGNKSNFDHNRAIAFAMVLPDKCGVKHICFRDKEADCLFDMFNARYLIHRRVCYHRVTTAVQIMIADALIEAIKSQSNAVKFIGEGGKHCNLKEATLDMIAYSKITDEIILQIYRSEDGKLQRARDIVDRIFRRKLYHFTDCRTFDQQIYRVQGNDKRTIHEIAKEDITQNCDDKTKKEIAVYVAKFDYGMGGQNPLKNVRFFTKTKKPQTAQPLEKVDTHVSTIFRPTKFSQQEVLVFCRSDDDEMKKKVKEIFDKWSTTSQE